MEAGFPAVECHRKTGTEPFLTSGTHSRASLLDFWQWAYSDLLGNPNRGRLAEFIVARALGLGLSEVRTEWDVCDLVTPRRHQDRGEVGSVCSELVSEEAVRHRLCSAAPARLGPPYKCHGNDSATPCGRVRPGTPRTQRKIYCQSIELRTVGILRRPDNRSGFAEAKPAFHHPEIASGLRGARKLFRAS